MWICFALCPSVLAQKWKVNFRERTTFSFKNKSRNINQKAILALLTNDFMCKSKKNIGSNFHKHKIVIRARDGTFLNKILENHLEILVEKNQNKGSKHWNQPPYSLHFQFPHFWTSTMFHLKELKEQLYYLPSITAGKPYWLNFDNSI